MLALQADVERPVTAACCASDQRVTSIWRNQRQHNIGSQIGIVLEIDARIELTQQPSRKETRIDMGRLQLTVVGRKPSGPDSVEGADAVGAGRETAEAAESWR
jgi:hypothetical protein